VVRYRILNLVVTVFYLYRIRVYNLNISYSSLAKTYSHKVKLNSFRLNAVS